MRFGIIAGVLFLLQTAVHAQVTDTLGYASFYSFSDTLYDSPNGGYAFGNNGYGDKAKAESYYYESPFVLRKVWLGFGAVQNNSGDANSVVRVTVYDNHGFGVTQYGESDSIAPDSIIAFVDVPVSDLLANGELTEVSFDSDTIVIRDRFSVGIDLTHLSVGDTVGLMSTMDGDAMGATNSWELTAGNTWFTVGQQDYSWGLDVDLAIFPLIDAEDPAGVLNMDRIAMQLYPNPATHQFYIEGIFDGAVAVDVFDLAGKRVLTTTVTNARNIIDIEPLPTGMYAVVVSGDSFRVSKKLLKY
ncbi:MAG: T9SS type A sorting domain-containing protein [Flavobacteriales bacterium]|nr:T9SS type A sorting domain-containing protein [Flavobacteriales bacterium]